MKSLLSAAVFLVLSVSSYAQVGYIQAPSLGITPIFTGAYTIPAQVPVNIQVPENTQVQSKAPVDNSEKVGRILNKNNEWVGALPNKIYIYYKNGDYLGFFTFIKGDTNIVTIYDELGRYLISGATNSNDVARIDSLMKTDAAK